MPAEPPPPLAYATPPPRATVADRQLRRAAFWNVLCAPLILVQVPGCLASAYLVARATVPSRRPMSPADFLDGLGPHPEQVLTPVVWYAVAGVAAAVSAALIARRRGRLLSVAIGLVICLAMPFGTVAGLTSVIILMRRTSADAYAAAAHVTASAP